MAWTCSCGTRNKTPFCGQCGKAQEAVTVWKAAPTSLLTKILLAAGMAAIAVIIVAVISHTTDSASIRPSLVVATPVLTPSTVSNPIPTEVPGAEQASSTLVTDVLPAAPLIQLPVDETSFISAVELLKNRYISAPNEFQKSSLRRERRALIAKIIPELSVMDWIGHIASMQTTQDERGILFVKLANSSISVETVNTTLSDALSPGTLIPHESKLYDQIAHFAVGDKVMFSGSFKSGDLDYAQEESVTEEGAMTGPEFLFIFKSVRAVDETQ